MNTMRLELTQKLNMTQQLVQAVMILAMSGQEVNELVDKQVLENPVLELVDNNTAAHRLDERWERGVVRQNAETASDDAVYALAEQTVSLQELLLQQVSLILKTAREKAIAEYIIGSLDENGYLEQSPERIARRLNVSKNAVNDVRVVIQDMEPPGFASLGIQEFLLFQLNRKSETDKTRLAKIIISDYLAALAKNDFDNIALATGAGLAEIQAAVDLIKQLNPRPVNAWLEKNNAQYVTPDIIIEKVEDKFVVSLNPIYTRILRVQDEYAQLRRKVDKETKKYINKNLRSAQWIIQCLEQREKTMRKISEIIVLLQQSFFESGHLYMQPLNLKEVAKLAGVHESTVSRAINHKYAQTPHGVISLKAFFPSGITTSSGNKITSAHIKKRIAEIIGTQTKISDKKITDLLAGEGIIIARRTVAKYRELIGIQSSFCRKK